MARYIATDANGDYVNLIEIEPEQVAEYEQLTGLTLELPPEPEPVEEPVEEPDPATMEAALNELGVITRE